MQRSTLLLVACAVVACGACKGGTRGRSGEPAITTPTEIPAPLGNAWKGSKASAWVRSLTDEVGPRLAGSEGDAKATAWGERTMKTLGLSNVHLEEVKVPRWDRGAESAELVAPFAHRLSLTALGGSVGTPDEGIEAEVLRVPSLEALTKLPDDAARGKIVFIDVETKPTKTGEGYGKAVGARFAGASAAAKKGAIAMIVRSIATSKTRLPHTGAMKYDDGVPKIPAAALAVPDAMLLQRLLEDPQARVRLRLRLGCRELGEAISQNVVGDVLGRDRPDDVVLLGAHLDSWDLGTGALDDGAGVGVVLEVARLVQALPSHPRRTVRVVLFADEESGVKGGIAYAERHQAELARHFAALELDVGGGKAWGFSYLAAEGKNLEISALASPLQALGVRTVAKGEHFGSDISPLRYAGVPVFDLDQDASTYFDFHHSADDTFDKIDAKALDQVVAAAASFAWSAAEMQGELGRVPETSRGKKWW
ncbi:MAG: M28 family peptidase [Polyangiales bacterium]